MFRCGQECSTLTELDNTLSHLTLDLIAYRHHKLAEHAHILITILLCQVELVGLQVDCGITEHHCIENRLRLHRERLEPHDGPVDDLKDLRPLDSFHLAHHEEVLEADVAFTLGFII